jgi:hypothetical protein
MIFLYKSASFALGTNQILANSYQIRIKIIAIILFAGETDELRLWDRLNEIIF